MVVSGSLNEGLSIRLDPEYANAYQSRAWLLATCADDSVRNGKEAVTLALQACAHLRVARDPTDLRERAPVDRQRGPALAATELPDFSRWGPVAEEPLNAVRRATSELLGRSWPAIPQVTQFESADITGLDQLRLRFKPEAVERGVHLTLTVLLIKALVPALKAEPRFNSSLDLARGLSILKHYYHIGVAADTPRGLLLPVLRDVDQKDVWQLAFELEHLTAR